MPKIIAQIYLTIGFITAILDYLDVIKLSIMGYQNSMCALNGNINCVNDGLTKMIQFLVDIIIGPALLAANLAGNSTLGIFGVLAAVIIILIAYGRK